MLQYIRAVGKTVIAFVDDLGQILVLFFQTLQLSLQRPWEIRNTINQMVEIGVNSLVVTTITALSTGMILALQSGITLESKMVGISQYLGAVVTIPMVRELGPLLTAMIVAGRIGSSIAAEIGTMKVTEQIDALVTMATNPIKYLAVPRLLACLVMLPLLTIFADVIGVFGGFIVATAKLNLSGTSFIDNALDMLTLKDIFSGLIKTVFFGAIIAMVGCYKGFKTTGGAEGVGQSTTWSVVVSLMGILVSDYFLTALLF